MQSPVISQVLFTEPLLLLESGLFIPNTMDVAKPSKSSTPTVLLNRPTALCCRKCPHRGHRLGLLISEETICPGLPHQIILASTILIKPDMNIQEHWFSNPNPPICSCLSGVSFPVEERRRDSNQPFSLEDCSCAVWTFQKRKENQPWSAELNTFHRDVLMASICKFMDLVSQWWFLGEHRGCIFSKHCGKLRCSMSICEALQWF